VWHFCGGIFLGTESSGLREIWNLKFRIIFRLERLEGGLNGSHFLEAGDMKDGVSFMNQR
jgi:hypothetical protein